MLYGGNKHETNIMHLLTKEIQQISKDNLRNRRNFLKRNLKKNLFKKKFFKKKLLKRKNIVVKEKND